MLIKLLFNKNNIIIAAVALYTVIMFIAITFYDSDTVRIIHAYITFFVALWVTGKTLSVAIRENDRGAKLFTALGISCLSIGNIYFILLHIVSLSPDTLSVGNFAQICCFLFFISALSSFKPLTKKYKIFVYIVNFISVTATIFCVYSIITNNLNIVDFPVLLLDCMCIILAAGLLKDKYTHFYALMMLVMSATDVLYIIEPLQNFLDSLSPALYLFLGLAVTGLKAGEYSA